MPPLQAPCIAITRVARCRRHEPGDQSRLEDRLRETLQGPVALAPSCHPNIIGVCEYLIHLPQPCFTSNSLVRVAHTVRQPDCRATTRPRTVYRARYAALQGVVISTTSCLPPRPFEACTQTPASSERRIGPDVADGMHTTAAPARRRSIRIVLRNDCAVVDGHECADPGRAAVSSRRTRTTRRSDKGRAEVAT